MNLDANIQKILSLLLKKWKLIIVCALLGTMLAYFYTANFTTLTYSSTVEFLAYAQDSQQELSESSNTQTSAPTMAQAASNTSKMNYAIKMLDTYIELFKTYEFNDTVAKQLNKKYNSSYTANEIQNAIAIQKVSETAMFKITVTTTNADKSFQIARQLESSIPKKMKSTNNGLVSASVEDQAIKAQASESRGYVKKMAIGLLMGAALAIAYTILRDFLDVRVKTAEELTERYGVAVLGTIPEFELRAMQTTVNKSGSKNKSESSKKGE